MYVVVVVFFFFKQKTAYEIYQCDWSSDVCSSDLVIIMWGIGYNQHIHGQNNVISIINLLTMTGNLAKPGCGPFSMTGQPNAMGERFTGGLTDRLPFNQPLKNAKHRKKIAEAWGVPEKNLVTAMNRSEEHTSELQSH